MTTPDLTVVVPTFGRPDGIVRLLERLAQQTLAPERFEVIVVDDGSPDPIEVPADILRARLLVLRQANAGPGAARNLAVPHARAPWTLILNDDALPAPDLLQRHLDARKDLARDTALLGTFHFTRRALASPFVQLLQRSDLLFDFPHLRHGCDHGWTYFWTCNLSLATELLRTHPFDAETFKEPIVEDVELGYRLARHGVRVRYDETLVAEHDHVLEPRGYFHRMLRLGVNTAKMYAKHRDPLLLHVPSNDLVGGRLFGQMRQQVEALHGTSQKLIDKLEALEVEHAGRTLPGALVEQVTGLVRQMGTLHFWRGLLLEVEGQDPVEVLERGPREGALTSIVVVSYDALEKTKKCVEALRRARDERHPTELWFVDNGSRDGSAAWLAQQPDVQLIRNAENRGAPCARNQALARVRGAYVVVMDNDAIVAPGWLRRLLFHADVDPRSGCIGPVSDRAAHGQQVPYGGASDLDTLAQHAQGWGQANDRRARMQNMLTSFCLLMRREVLDEIGGFDQRFSPWGFEDDDFTLRAALAGFRNRCALDVFVRHEHYAGAKAARHDQLLRQNWRRFAEKWSGSSALEYGDYQALEPALKRRFTPAELRVELPSTADVPSSIPSETPVAARG